jgi:high-affinity nickel permease
VRRLQLGFHQSPRKLYYNFMITAVSVAVVVLIGGIEALGLASDQLSLHGKFWESIGALNDNFNALGFAIICLPDSTDTPILCFDAYLSTSCH